MEVSRNLLRVMARGLKETEKGRVPRAPCICICNAAVSARAAGRSDFASPRRTLLLHWFHSRLVPPIRDYRTGLSNRVSVRIHRMPVPDTSPRRRFAPRERVPRISNPGVARNEYASACLRAFRLAPGTTASRNLCWRHFRLEIPSNIRQGAALAE